MRQINRFWATLLAGIVLAGLLTSCGFRRKKYENPITKDTMQPDKILFDKAIRDIEKGRYDIARLTLQTLISTYESSEFLAKAKLALADSWFRQGGASGYANAEAEYKDFILFYPMLEEAAEAQQKICLMRYRQMEKPDRDPEQAMKADEECRAVLTQFPNSKFAPQVEQLLRNIQEVLAEHEYRAGNFYFTKGSYVAAANRLQGLTDHYPLYSKADESLWKLGESYSKLGPRFTPRAAAAYSKIVQYYPLSPYVEDARKKLAALEQPIPDPDPVALNRMKYELANRRKPGMMSHFWGIFRKGPDVSMAAKSGAPANSLLRPPIPVSVPGEAAGTALGSDVTVSTLPDSGALEQLPDARQSPPAGQPQTNPTKPSP
ncbi:MAG: outer membrane protein assembly factor BamD [Bryobacteraceae bacterium]